MLINNRITFGNEATILAKDSANTVIERKNFSLGTQWTKILYCSNDDSKTDFDFKERLMWEDEEKLWFHHKSILWLFHLNNKGNSWNRLLCILQSKLHKVSFQITTSKLNKLYWSRFYWWNYQIKV